VGRGPGRIPLSLPPEQCSGTLRPMTIDTDNGFRRNQRVVATAERPGVPLGTEGKVLYMAGMTWKRARVAFDNGTEVGGLDSRHLADARQWQRDHDEAARQEQRDAALREAEATRARLRSQLQGDT